MTRIIKALSKPEKYFEEKCFITELFNSGENPDVSVARARVNPGVTTVLHWLKDTEEKYFILSGSGEVEIDGKMNGTVEAGDLVIIPKNSTQRIKNIGADDLIFICICTPRFEAKNYNLR
jgi:mannose-6-phosphate isomerase-like protein (cupin superfamily)